MKINLSGNLARFVNYKKELKLEGDGIQTVGDVLHALVAIGVKSVVGVNLGTGCIAGIGV